MAIVIPTEGLRPEHRDGLDSEFAQCDQPIAQDGLQTDVVAACSMSHFKRTPFALIVPYDYKLTEMCDG
jgi:hypothetical protein